MSKRKKNEEERKQRTIFKIVEGLKSGAIEIIDDGAGDILQKLFPSYEGGLRSQPTESEETANNWRNGFLGGVLEGSVEEILGMIGRK